MWLLPQPAEQRERGRDLGSHLDHCPPSRHHEEILGTGEAVRSGGFGSIQALLALEKVMPLGSKAATHPLSFPRGIVRAESPRDGSLQTRHQHCNGVDLLPLNCGVFRNFVPIFCVFINLKRVIFYFCSEWRGAVTPADADRARISVGPAQSCVPGDEQLLPVPGTQLCSGAF